MSGGAKGFGSGAPPAPPPPFRLAASMSDSLAAGGRGVRLACMAGPSGTAVAGHFATPCRLVMLPVLPLPQGRPPDSVRCIVQACFPSSLRASRSIMTSGIRWASECPEEPSRAAVALLPQQNSRQVGGGGARSRGRVPYRGGELGACGMLVLVGAAARADSFLTGGAWSQGEFRGCQDRSP